MKLHRELLTSERHTDGVWHARYPTALTTLCGQPVNQETRPYRRRVPTCGRCSRGARLLDKIDGSMPEWWNNE